MKKMTKRRSRAVMAATVAFGLGLAFAPQASAAVNWSWHAASDYASARTISTTSTSWGRSYAQHGNRSALSGWSNLATSARADSGTSNSYSAHVWWSN